MFTKNENHIHMNKVFAHPQIITWILGATTLDSLALFFMPRSGFTYENAGILLRIFIPLTFFGYVFGMLVFWPKVRALCCRYNGGPLKIGDEVLVLTGPDRGKKAQIYETPIGRGGWELARLDLGEERKEKYQDIFEQYSLMKLHKHNKNSQEDAAKSAAPLL